MNLYIIHMRFTRRRLLLTAAALVLVTGMTLLLAGCFRSSTPCEEVDLATNDQRVAYLEGLGWQVSPEPVETLDLQLPEKLEDEWDAYAKLQKGQGLPFSEFAGQAVKRYTYTVTNYPEIPQGVQANLYLWGDQIIGGDVIFTGQGGFQTDLAFPKA